MFESNLDAPSTINHRLQPMIEFALSLPSSNHDPTIIVAIDLKDIKTRPRS